MSRFGNRYPPARENFTEQIQEKIRTFPWKVFRCASHKPNFTLRDFRFFFLSLEIKKIFRNKEFEKFLSEDFFNKKEQISLKEEFKKNQCLLTSLEMKLIIFMINNI